MALPTVDHALPFHIFTSLKSPPTYTLPSEPMAIARTVPAEKLPSAVQPVPRRHFPTYWISALPPAEVKLPPA